jgi:hypothetical protein
MRTIIAKASMALSAVCLCGFALYAQSYEANAKIPFSFHIGNTVLPAGEYQLAKFQNQPVILLHNRETGRGNFVDGDFGAENTAHRRGVIVFHRYGNEYFLAEMWNQSGVGTTVPTTKSEKEFMSRPTEIAASIVSIPVRAD